MFENLTCPVGPHDKSKIYTEDAPELYENIELPVLSLQEDPYGGENCKCNCHNGDETTCKNISEHCISCGTRVCHIFSYFNFLVKIIYTFIYIIFYIHYLKLFNKFLS